jgi:CRISPR system Cascade subunit CasB
MSRESRPHSFAVYLESLAENRAALAALRQGLGQPPGSVPAMHRYVIPHLPVGVARREEEACYVVAGLFGLHPASTTHGNLGDNFARTLDRANPDRNVSTERRFSVLLAAHRDDLPDHLRQAISFLHSREELIPVNYHQLLRDIRNWDHPDRFVQKNWANAFWRQPARASAEQQDEG